MHSNITVQLHHARWKTLLRPYCKTVREAVEGGLRASGFGLRGRKKFEITVVLADDDFIHQLNRDFRGMDKPTNVLSFPESRSPKPGAHLGDLVLALETIEREAKEQGKTFKNHVRHLLVHGTLHLLGYDHEREKEAENMERLEIKILKSLGVANPYL